MGAGSFFPQCTSTRGVLHEADLAHRYHWLRKQPPLMRFCCGYSSAPHSQYQASVPLKSPSEGKFCCAIPANGHMESIFNSKSPHFRVVAFSSISFHHSKELIKNLLLQQGRLVLFGFYLLKNNHLSATEKEEKNLSLKIWRSASL